MRRARERAVALLVCLVVVFAARRTLRDPLEPAGPAVHGPCLTLVSERLPAPLLVCAEPGDEAGLRARASAAAARLVPVGEAPRASDLAPFHRTSLDRTAAPARAPMDGASELAMGRPLDLLRAGEDELSLLPGIGPARARAIAAHRDRGGRLETVDDLTRIRGIGPATVAQIAPLVRCGEPPRPAAELAADQSP